MYIFLEEMSPGLVILLNPVNLIFSDPSLDPKYRGLMFILNINIVLKIFLTPSPFQKLNWENNTFKEK